MIWRFGRSAVRRCDGSWFDVRCEKLPQFRRAGWITDDAAVHYQQQLLKKNQAVGLVASVDQDLQSEQI